MSETTPATNWLAEVQAVCRRLRAEDGCPWDRAQTLQTMTPYLLEETYEVIDAIDSGVGLEEELGDALFLLVFVLELAAEQGLTDLEKVVRANLEKIIRRHPHVFGEHRAANVGEAMEQWERAKRKEKNDTAAGIMKRRPEALPGLTLGFRIAEKAGAVGFEWKDWREALAKAEEEFAELRAALEAGEPRAELELGDTLFALANLSRFMKADPERAVRGSVRKFLDRFHHMELALRERGVTPAPEVREQMLELWRAARRAIP